jgi:hypothetical protein
MAEGLAQAVQAYGHGNRNRNHIHGREPFSAVGR